MARPVAEIEEDIRALSADEKHELLRTLIEELDTPADSNVEEAWLEESQRRYREILDGGNAGNWDYEKARQIVDLANQSVWRTVQEKENQRLSVDKPC